MSGRIAQAIVLAIACGQLLRSADASAIWRDHVQPLFDVQCVKCHGPIQQKGGLELDSPEALLKGGEDGAVVEPGHPEKSLLYKYLAADSDPHMPPKKQLSDADREHVRRWIAGMASASATAQTTPKAVREFPSVTAAIDGLIAEGWAVRNVTPVPPLPDALWCRRVYLDLAGRIPTPAEVDQFANLPAPSRRDTLVDRLLAGDEYPVHMRELWDVFLMGRPKRDAHEDRRKQNGWWSFLENSFRLNRPWNETVHDLLTARPARPEYQGASWFLYERRNDFQAIAEAVAPIVYGTKIDCAQCHDHPLVRQIKQAHYWGLVAAFNRGKNVEGGNAVGESAIGGFINFTNLKKESQPADILLLTGRKVEEVRPAAEQKEEDRDDRYVDPTAKVKVPKFSRREAFAEAATRDNPLLARAFVNRLWATLIGRGLAHPADEMNARNPPSHPELLDWLAQDFVTHQYDIRRLVRGLVLSRVYGLSAGGGPPEAFAGALERPLTAEQLARSWRVAAGLPPEDDTLRRAAIAALPAVLPKDYNATFQQAQFLASSPALTEVLKPVPGGTVTRLAALPERAARVTAAFAAVYARSPQADEAKQALAFLEGRPDQPEAAIRDLLWALMTSAEFLTMP